MGSSADNDRFWLDTMEDTISMVRMIFNDRTLFLMLAGAVFALHQDMLKACGVDMRNLARFSEDIRLTLNALYEIDDNNLDLLQGQPTQGAQDYKTHMVSARMRSVAARIWLLTTYARVGARFGMTSRLCDHAQSWCRQFVDDAGCGEGR